MSESTTTKTCGLCGTDCSNKPRTKDASGRYFCKSCYESAKQRTDRAAAPPRASETQPKRSSAPAASTNPKNLLVDDASGGVESAVRSPLDDLLNAMPVSGADVCPGCGGKLAHGAQVCVSCGYDARIGSAINIAVQHAPRQPILGGWLGPIILGGVMTLAALIGAMSLYGTEIGFLLFAMAFLVLLIAWHLWVIFNARKVEGAQRKILTIPGYAFYYAFVTTTNRYLRCFTVGVIAVVISFFVLGYEWERQEAIKHPGGFHDERDGIMNIPGSGPRDVRPGPPPVDPRAPRPDQIPEWDPNRSAPTTKPATKSAPKPATKPVAHS